MPGQTDLAGIAALSICEALLLAMNDHKLLPEREITGVLCDAAAAHENRVGDGAAMAMHQGVVRLINGIMTGMGTAGRP